MTWHVTVVPVPDNVHGDVAIVPAPLLVIVTVPIGVLAGPTSLSVTVAVQVDGVPASTEDGLHVTVVVDIRTRLNWTVLTLPS